MLTGQKVILREKCVSDADNDYVWRCDPDLCRLDAIPPLNMPYSEYEGYYVEELQYATGRRRKFAIDCLEDGKHIGNCMYYDIDWNTRQAELGIMIGDRNYWGQGYGSDAVRTLVRHIFNDTNVDRIYLKTLEWNVRAQRCFRKCGFVICGRSNRQGHDFLIMELHRSWMKRLEDSAEVARARKDSKTTLPYAT